MSLRDDLLPVVDLGNQLAQDFGLSRFAVTIRRRTWSGTRIGDGTPTNQDLVMSPPPTVTFKSPFREQMTAIMASGGTIRDRYYEISDITPAYTNADGSTAGYTPEQLRLTVGPDLGTVECVVVLVGDDGMARECKQVIFEDGDPFAYSMIVQETDNPTVSLVSLAVAPNPATVASGSSAQMRAVGTFADGSTSDLSGLVVWQSSDTAKATIDMLGKATGVAAGTSSITAFLAGVTSPAVTLTVT